MDARYFDFVFRGIGELDGVKSELEELLALNIRLQNQNLENAKKAREERDARRQAAEEAKQAAMAQIQAELGVGKALDSQKGIIEELRNRIRLLKQGREEANDVATINKYNAALQISQKELNTLTGATDKFKGSNGFWREMSGYVATAFAVSSITDWTGKVFEAQSKTEAFGLSLKRLVGEKEAAVIENQLKNLITNTPLQFEGAVKGVEKLIFAYQNAGQSTKTVIKDFEAYGNVAKGNEENLKGVIKALEDVGNQGKLTGQEILQFGNAGVNIIGLLAESTGKSRKEIKAMQADGALSFDLVREALIKAGSEGGKFAGAMSVAMGTVSGKVSNFKDAVFFAMSNTGEYFKENAKSAVSWATSLVQSLFGTESATKRTIDILKTGIGTWIAYEVATRASAAATLANTTIQKIGLVIKGETILANSAMTGSYNVLTAAETEATVAARAFNTTLASNPFGLIVLAIGTAVAGYQMYRASVESAQEEQKKLSSNIADALVPLKSEQIEFNTLTKAVLNTNLATEERKKKLDELKTKFPEQLTGINNLQDAELKLGGVIRSTNADFVTRAKLLENEVRINYNREKANVWLKEQIELEAKLATASTQRTSMVTGTDGIVRTYASEREEIQKSIDARKRWVNNALESNETIAKYGESLTGKLKYQYEQDATNKVTAAKDGNDKAKKEKENHKKEIEKIEKVSNDLISSIRADFRALNDKEDKKSFELQIKRIEARYKLEIDKIQESKNPLSEKMLLITKQIILEEKETATIKRQIEEIKTIDNLHKQQAKNIAELSKEYVKNINIRNDMIKEQGEHEREIIKLEQERKKSIEELIGSISNEIKGFIDYSRVADIAKNSLQEYSTEKAKLDKMIGDSAFKLEDIAAQEKVVNAARERSVKASNESQMASYQLLLQVAVQVFNSLKSTLVNSLQTINKSLAESNRIYQDWAKEQRAAELKSYEQDLDRKLELTEGNFDKQLEVLKSYLLKAEQAINKSNAADLLAEEYQAITDNIIKSNNKISDAISGISINPVENWRNAFQTMGAIINRFKSGNIDAAQTVVASSDRVIEKLGWQRDNTIDILNRTIEIYRDKYSQQTQVVKDELDKQVSFVKDSLEKNITALSSWYDAQRDTISASYQDILDNNVHYTDLAFEEQLSIWNGAIDEQEAIIIGARDSQTAILKKQYENGEIDLKTYIAQKTAIDAKYNSDILALRTKHYESLTKKTIEYTESEKATLKNSLESGFITQQEYDSKMATLDDIAKQRQADVKAIIKSDRDKDLVDLKANYLDVKVLAEQKAADDIVALQTKAKEQLEKLDREFADKSASIEKEKYETALRYNSMIFEEKRRLAIANLQIAYSEAQGEAWKNPLTAPFVLKRIKSEFQVLIDQIAGSINPFAGQIAQDLANQSKDTPVVTENTQYFNKGTTSVDGQEGVDKIPAMLTKGERIIPTYLNDMLKAKFGSDITNEGLVFRALNPLPIMNYDAIANMGNVSTTFDKKAMKETMISAFKEGMKEMKQVNVNVVNGHPSVEERSSNRMIKYVS